MFACCLLLDDSSPLSCCSCHIRRVPAAQAAQVQPILTALKSLGAESQWDAQRNTFAKQAVFPVVAVSREKLAEYLRTPPKGVDRPTWEEVRLEQLSDTPRFCTAKTNDTEHNRYKLSSIYFSSSISSSFAFVIVLLASLCNPTLCVLVQTRA